jgi:hypothetical protein
VMSSRLPIGVATTYNVPVSGWAAFFIKRCRILGLVKGTYCISLCPRHRKNASAFLTSLGFILIYEHTLIYCCPSEDWRVKET